MLRPPLRQATSRLIVGIRLFAASYAAAFAIAAIRFDGVWLRGVCAAVAILSVLTALSFVRSGRHQVAPISVTVTSVDDVGSEVGGYLATYLLPFIVVPTPSLRDLLAYGIFLVLLAVVYIRSDLIRVNPTMYVLGYKLVKINAHDGSGRYLLTRQEPTAGQVVAATDHAGFLVARGVPIEP